MLEEFAPEIDVLIGDNDNSSWYNSHIQNLFNISDYYYKIWSKNKTEENRLKFKKTRNKANQSRDKAKFKSNRKFLDSKLPPKKLWKN